MVLFTEFMDALQGAIANHDMIAGLKKRGLDAGTGFLPAADRR